jgi:hypothetical protein
MFCPSLPNKIPGYATGSAKGCQGFRETKIYNGGRVSLAVLNWYIRIEISEMAFDLIIPSKTSRDQSQLQSRSFQILYSIQSEELAID